MAVAEITADVGAFGAALRSSEFNHRTSETTFARAQVCPLWGPFCLVVALTATIGCASLRTTQPLPQIEDSRWTTIEPESEDTRPLTEEALSPHTPPLVGPGAQFPRPFAEEFGQEHAPSLIAMIGPSTPAHVAAATRMVEGARKNLAAGDTDAAIDELERAMAVDPNNPYAYYYLAEAHFSRGTYDQAVVFADKAALLSARTDSRWLSRSRCLQGEIFEASGRFADARAAYEHALDADEDNDAARAGLTRLGGSLIENP